MVSATAVIATALALLLCACAHKVAEKQQETPGFTVAVLRNPTDKVVRIYGRYPRKALQEEDKAACRFQVLDSGSDKGVPPKDVPANVTVLKEYNDHADELLRPLADAFLECSVAGETTWPETQDRGMWRVTGVANLNGSLTGKEQPVHELREHFGGRIAICTAPILHDQDEIKEWIDYHLNIGIPYLIMHTPDLPPRIRAMKRRVRSSVSKSSEEDEALLMPVQEITFPHQESNVAVVWAHYDSPFFTQEADELALSSCMFRVRHVANYVVQMDTSEYLYMREHAATQRPQKLRPVLEGLLPEGVPTLEVQQELYPKECQLHKTGDYPSRFSLTAGDKGVRRLIVRPQAAE